MSDTPRTDKASFGVYPYLMGDVVVDHKVVTAEFAEQLETELTEAQAEIERLKAALEAEYLKLCPFCGGTAEVGSSYPNDHGDSEFYVICSECGARTSGFLEKKMTPDIEAKVVSEWNNYVKGEVGEMERPKESLIKTLKDYEGLIEHYGKAISDINVRVTRRRQTLDHLQEIQRVDHYVLKRLVARHGEFMRAQRALERAEKRVKTEKEVIKEIIERGRVEEIFQAELDAFTEAANVVGEQLSDYEQEEN